MTNRYKNTALVISLMFITALSFAQEKQQSIPDFKNPFLDKANNQSPAYAKPRANGRVASSKKHLPKIQRVNGSIYADLRAEKLSITAVSKDINSWLGLNDRHSFKEVAEKTDERGISHRRFQALYKGYPVEGGVIMTHSKSGLITSLNGQLDEILEIETQVNTSAKKAKEIAKSYLGVTHLINDYPVETVVTRIPNENGIATKLAQKVRIDSYSPFVMCHVYVDAKTGDILNKINLISHAEVPGTGQTLYSGAQAIICDSFTGGFRLRESGRKIETYNGTNATDLNSSGFVGSSDFTNASTSWTGVPLLSSFSITAIAQSWWYTVFADETPDLFIKIKDGSNQIVFTSGYFNNTTPSVTFDGLNILLTTPPYSVEIWDYDVVDGNDLGGSYTISTNAGTQSWSGAGNSGNYTIATSGNLAIDVHWGMEVSYDFYKSILNRNSFDGNGSVIKQYINPPTYQSQFGFSPNNAGAYPAPYNVMAYGLGDGESMKPVVGLDVEGHEFTHMVVANNGNGGLVYQGESGALNESFSDIFGTCVEFYSGVSPDWTIGEDVMVGKPFMRSMSNPNGGQQPDTYGGQFWANPTNLEHDHGGVHINSGVQNFWFYLLSQGGTGTNDLGHAYSVTPIGIEHARQIAYRNLITYLGPNATYQDSYNGSLQAAQDLYGNPSTQYTAVRRAWYAVGIGNDPDNYCSGTTNLTASAGQITDGSGTAQYNNNATCKWVIAPPGATRISLNFTTFDTESEYDTVFVYDGPDDSHPILATWWGNTLPPAINTTSGNGAMCVKFVSDVNTTANGWTANYTSTVTTPSCGGGTVLSGPTGTVNDGSAGGNYGNNQKCYWFIAPPCATSVTLSFSQFNTEQNYDGVIIYDDFVGTHQLAVLTGTSIPSSVTSTTGKMLVIFTSDYSTTSQGFSASYNSAGSAPCTGVTTLSSADYGTLADASGANNYCNNLDCQWLIQPPQATKVTLNFSAFDLEDASPDGKTIYDAVEVYDGTTTAAPLLGRFTGSNIPPAITSTGASMLVRFSSDLEMSKQGWTATYTSTQNSHCLVTANLTAENGTFNDGSGISQYSNNSSCSWLIQPPDASAVTLTFSAFSTELNFDGVIVYDGANNTSPVLGEFSGATIPSPVTSTGGSMYVEFISDPAVRGAGWTANYTSEIIAGVEEDLFKKNLKLFPNPTDGTFVIESSFESAVEFQIMDVLGKQILKTHYLDKGEYEINATELPKGIYLVKFRIRGSRYSERLIIK